MQSLRRALGLFRPDLSRIGILFALLLFSLGLGILKPWPLAWIFDHVLGQKPWPAWLAMGSAGTTAQLAALAAALLGLHAGHALLSSFQTYLAIDLGLRGLTRVRNQMFALLQRLSLRFRSEVQTGDLLFRAATDTYAFQTFFQHGFVTLLSSVLYLGFLQAVMWHINRPLTLLALGLMPMLVLTIRIFGAQMRRRGLQAQQAESKITSLLHQGILTLPLVQSYSREDHETRKFGQQAALAKEHKLAQHGWEVLYGLMVSLCLALGTAGIAWLGARQVLQDHLTLGELIVFLAYLAQMFDPLNQLSHVGTTLTSATVGIQRVFELLDTPDEVVEDPHPRALLRPGQPPAPTCGSDPLHVQGRISFENVSFAYRPGLSVLHEISFQVGPGQSAAIIGPSGAGKTTLLNLLPRFFDPSSGRVLLDGVDLRRLRIRDLRAQVALLLQEPIILPATVAENIAYGRPEASLGEIRQAAQAAHADLFIQKLPQGYDTPIGEAGAQLSVGERQRLNLARAFLKNAPILLLDEPTSALDSESEQLVVQALSNLMKDRTTLLVAHRLTTIRRVDYVVVLQEGRLTQFGSPATLKQEPGYFARVTEGQTRLD